MAIQQTRFTYPMVDSKAVRLSIDLLQKYHTPTTYGGIDTYAAGSRVTIYRYVGRRDGRFPVSNLDPATRLWSNELPFVDGMKLLGWDKVAVIVGSAPAGTTNLRSGSSASISDQELSLKIGSGIPIEVGMHVTATATGTLNAIMGMVTSYVDGTIRIWSMFTTGSGTFTDWTVSVMGGIVETDSNLYIDIDTKCPLFLKPGVYADAWDIADTDGDIVGPMVKYFRLDPKIVGFNPALPNDWFNFTLWPEGMPFQSLSQPNVGFQVTIGVEPMVKSAVDASILQAVKIMLSSAYVQLIEIWFYSHEITGDLDPPVQVTLPSPVTFDNQYFNFFHGAILPTLFEEPGSYRLKFRIVFEAPPPWIESGTYHDFWKTFYVGRQNDSAGTPSSSCGIIPPAVSGCSAILGVDATTGQYEILAKGSLEDFLEPRDPYVPYVNERSASKLNLAMQSEAGAGTEITLLKNAYHGDIDGTFAPFVVADGMAMEPSVPVNGLAPGGAVINDYTASGNVVNVTRTDFAQVFYATRGTPETFGRVTRVFRDKQMAISLGLLYWYFISIVQTGKFYFISLRRASSPTNIVLNPLYYLVLSNGYCVISKAYLDALVGANDYVLAIHFDKGESIEPSEIRFTRVAFGRDIGAGKEFDLHGKPTHDVFPEIILNPYPMMRYVDYDLHPTLTSTDTKIIATGVHIFNVVNDGSIRNGHRVRAMSINTNNYPIGDYMEGTVLSSSATLLRIAVDQVLGSGNSRSKWKIHPVEIDMHVVRFAATPSFPLLAWHDAGS
jgi:hypothetical protein